MNEVPSGPKTRLESIYKSFNVDGRSTLVLDGIALTVLGQHTEEVLLELGYDAARIRQLREQKVIG